VVNPTQIIVVGGGTAGLVSALILKKMFNVEITIIKSNQIGIIGVGEGSTEHWNEFLKYSEIDYKELIRETDATIKLGVYFTNGWSKHNYYHNIGCIKSKFKLSQINYGILKSFSSNEDPIRTSCYLNLNNLVYNETNESVSNQYHFNTFKLNNFLIKKCLERGIKIVDDTIVDVSLDDNGIKSIKGIKDYFADFYIDCTGFKRILISKLNAKWISYSSYLTMNEAIAFPTGDTEEYTPYTESKRTIGGWMWRIPTYGRWGNGHVFNSNLINADKAKEIAEQNLGYEIEVAKHVKFNPGALDKCLIKNCLAVGLAANFIEPLEATSIGTTINQMFLFNHYFPHVNNNFYVDEYNNKINDIMDNIRDFVLIHYLNDKNVLFPSSLKDKLKMWKTRPPIQEDFCKNSYYLFNSSNFTQVLCGSDFYNIDQIKDYLKIYNLQLTARADLEISHKEFEYINNKQNHISHKKWLENIRNMNNGNI